MSIPLNEVAKFTNNPEWQKNIQLANQVLINLQTGLNSFFNKPEVKQTFDTLQKALDALNEYVKDPVFQKKLSNFQNLVLDVANKQEFQEKLKNTQLNNEEIYSVFEQNLTNEINVAEELPDFKTEEEKNKYLKLFFSFILAFLMFHLENYEPAIDLKEAYFQHINNIDSHGITISRINLREGPSFQREPIIVIPRNTALKVYKESQNGWVKVSVNQNNINLKGYVSEAYIKRTKNTYDLNSFLPLGDE